jgi:hypothetical protein
MRFALVLGLESVPEHLVPGAAYDPNLRTLVSPVEDARMTLSPNGWHPVYVSGKVWLAKVAKPLSEEEAAERIQAGNHNGGLSSTGSVSSSRSNTYAPRYAPAVAVSDTENDPPSQLGFLAVGNSRI